MPSYSDSANWDGKSPSQWDITHKGIYFYNGKNCNSNNISIEKCVLKNYRGEVIYGGTYTSENIQIIDTTIENSVTGISAEGINLIEGCNFNNITFNSFEAYVVTDMVVSNCKFENCNRGLELLNNNKWKSGIKCEIKNCYFYNIEYGIRTYYGGKRYIDSNNFTDCNLSVYITDTDDNSEYIICNNTCIMDKYAKANLIYAIANVSPTKISNNVFKRSNNAKNNNLKASAALSLGYSSSSPIENLDICILENNYIESGYCVYGESEKDKDIPWEGARNANSIACKGLFIASNGNPYDTSSPYKNGVYRPCKIDISGKVKEDCDITIKIEYYTLGGEKNQTTEETIYEESKKAGYDFSVTFDKPIITDTRNVYPKIKIYNSKNSSSAVEAKFTLTQR